MICGQHSSVFWGNQTVEEYLLSSYVLINQIIHAVVQTESTEQATELFYLLIFFFLYDM